MGKKLLGALKANLVFLSGVERKIAAVILEDPKKFTSYSLTELSEVASVSQGSIINFANKFAGGGFPALKMQIALGLSDYEKQPFSAVAENDDAKVVLKKVADDTQEALRNLQLFNDGETLQRTAERIMNAKKVEIYGVFRSAVVANDFYYQLLTLGIPASFVSDVLTCAVSASMLEKDSLVIAVSSSGKTKDVIDAVKIAKGNGVPVVCLTAHKDSPLASISDEVLIAPASGNSVSGRDMEIRFSQLALTDALCAYIRNKSSANGEKLYFGLRDILNSHNVND